MCSSWLGYLCGAKELYLDEVIDVTLGAVLSFQQEERVVGHERCLKLVVDRLWERRVCKQRGFNSWESDGASAFASPTASNALSHNLRSMESRKRSRTEDGDTSRAKKRAIKDDQDSPGSINGVASDTDEPRDDHNLEVNTSCSRQ